MQKRKAGFALLIAGVLVLSACGQRDEGGDASEQLAKSAGSIPGNSGTEGLGVRVITDANSISTGGTDIANVTALVTDESNNAVADQAVQFSSTGGVLQSVSAFTDGNGEASAALKLPYDFQNQDIVVTVSAGTSSAEVKVIAEGSRLEVTGPQTLVAGNQAELVVRLIAGNEEPIANQVISANSSAGNSIQPAEAVTNPDGQVSLLVGTENSSDTVLISALNGTVSTTHTFEVAAEQLRFENDLANAELNVG
ncbi:MAG: Ig-like domain-containing protein, partial [Granulosicoccus sp.]